MRRKAKFLIIVYMVLLLTGCGRQREETMELFYREEVKAFSELIREKGFDTYNLIGAVCRKEGCFFALEGVAQEKRQYSIYQVHGEKVRERFTRELLEGTGISSFDVGADGSCYLLEERYNEESGADDSYVLVLDEEGNVRSELSVSDWLNGDDRADMLRLGKEDVVYLFCQSGKICVLDREGNWQYEIAGHRGELLLEANRMSDESVIFVSAQYSGEREKLNVYRILPEKRDTELVAKLEGEDCGRDILINGAGKYDFYLRDNTCISGYLMETKELVPLMRWEENDFLSDLTEGICALSEDKWAAFEQDGQGALIYMEKREGEPEREKQQLKLACMYADSTLQKQVANFNRENEAYSIEVVSYNENADPRQAFFVDLTTGEGADIIVLPEGGAETLFQKGILEDLYPFIEGDQVLDREDFLPNILKAYEWDGRLYQTVSRVNVSGWVMKQSLLGEKGLWNREVFEGVLSKHPGITLFPDASSGGILDTLLEEMPDSLIQWEEGTCEFQSEVFYNLLELAEGYEGEKVPQEEIVQRLREEQLLFSDTVVNPFEVELYSIALEDDFTVVGSPFAEGAGGVFWSSDMQCGICVHSDNKDGAWQFVRNYFTRDYQALDEKTALFGVAEDGIPIRKDCFEAFVKRYTATEPYEENGQRIEPIQGNVSTGVSNYAASPMTAVQEKLFREIVTGTTKRRRRDEQVRQIILEEAEAYFHGERGKEETAERIQDRVSKYLDERK